MMPIHLLTTYEILVYQLHIQIKNMLIISEVLTSCIEDKVALTSLEEPLCVCFSFTTKILFSLAKEDICK